MIGRRGEEQLLLVGGPVVARALQAQCPLKVQELAHEVEVWGNVGLLPLDKVIGVVEGEVESLHQVGHGDRDGAADAGQAVDQDAALLRSGLVCGAEGKSKCRGKLYSRRTHPQKQLSDSPSNASRRKRRFLARKTPEPAVNQFTRRTRVTTKQTGGRRPLSR